MEEYSTAFGDKCRAPYVYMHTDSLEGPPLRMSDDEVKEKYPDVLIKYMLENYNLRDLRAEYARTYSADTIRMMDLLSWALEKQQAKHARSRNLLKINAKTSSEDGYGVMYLDSGADSCSIGGDAWHIDYYTGRYARVSGYKNENGPVDEKVPIGGGITAVDLPSGEAVLLRANESTIDPDANSLLSNNQLQAAGCVIYEKARRFGGKSAIKVDDLIVPLHMDGGLMAIKIRKPTEQELQDLPVYDLTMDEPWYPDHWTEEPLSQSEYEQLQDELQQINHNLHQRHLVKPDPTTIAPYLLHPGEETVKKTLENTTTLGTTNSQWPMRQHYKPRNAALSRRRFQEGYATDTGFATVTSYEGYNCFQFFYGINSHYESAYGLTRESDGPKALLDFFRQEGLPISLLRDNSKMQSSEVWSDHCRKFWVYF